MKKIIKVLFRLFCAGLLCLIVLLGYYMPQIAAYISNEEDKVTLKELPNVTLEMKEQLTYTEKFKLANAASYKFEAKKTTHTRDEIKKETTNILNKLLNHTGLCLNTNIEPEFKLLVPYAYMDAEERKAVFWQVEFFDGGSFYSFVFDDETMSLLSFYVFVNGDELSGEDYIYAYRVLLVSAEYLASCLDASYVTSSIDLENIWDRDMEPMEYSFPLILKGDDAEVFVDCYPLQIMINYKGESYNGLDDTIGGETQ